MDLADLTYNSDFGGYQDSFGQLYTLAEVAAAVKNSSYEQLPAEVTSAWDFSSLTQTAKDIVTAVNSIQLQQINLERARKGLAPLNPANYAPQVGLNLSAGTMNTIMIAALGLGAIMLLKRR